nr:putative e3 ubiquitin-protein ligase lin-1 [Quercus suber]
MDQKDMVRLLVTSVENFTRERLINKEQRTQHKEQCAERLAAEDVSCDKDTEVRYSDQAVLANLDWGIEALEEPINTSNMETKLARLEYAEKMLQVRALLNSNQKTAGVPNFYLSAWAHLNLAYMWKLRNNVHNAALHMLEMFIILSSHGLILLLKFGKSSDLDQYFNESLMFSMGPEQLEKLQKLEQLYGESLDENTRLFAKYYKDCMNSDSNLSKKVVPMLPIAEPPMTPLHEVSHSIPDYVKFGPILPKSAGFSPIIKSKFGERETRETREASRLNLGSTASLNLKESARWDTQEGLLDENEDQDENYSEYEPDDYSSVSTSLPSSPPVRNDHSFNSADSDGEVIGKLKFRRKINSRTRSFDSENSQVLENSTIQEVDEGSQSYISLPMSEKLTTRTRPPKDFVCPIRSQIFFDPVTLETGQTYERKAIQEWLERGNVTCPITRQPLSASVLPKTNYVLKRLISSWKEQYPDLAQEFSYSETPRDSFRSSTKEIRLASTLYKTSDISCDKSIDDYLNYRKKRFMRAAVSTSPTSVISQAAVEAIINNLKPYGSCLSTSDSLQECEAAVLAIARLWKESKADPGVFIQSNNCKRVCGNTVSFSEQRNSLQECEAAVLAIARLSKESKADPGVKSFLSNPTIVNGFVEILSASLSREVLRTSIYILSELVFADEGVGNTLTSVESDFDCLAALLKNGLSEAAVLIYQLTPAFAQLSAHDLESSLFLTILNKSEDLDDIQFVMEPKDAAIALLEQILMGGDECSRSLGALSVISANGIPALCKRRVDFLSELVQLHRRTFCNQILQIIKDEGAFSTMHTFLVYLQMAPAKQQLAIAALLLQLSHGEEAIDILIEALRRKEFYDSQMMALDALISLSGRLTSSGKSYAKAWLLKIAGFDQPYKALMKAEQLRKDDNDLMETMEEEEKAASSWERRVAFVLCSHENGSIFKALEECLKSDSLEMARSCLVLATWLTYMLSTLPHTGVRDAARKSLLDEFINVLQSSKNLEEKILVTLAMKTFISDPCKYNASETELWSCSEMVELDSSANVEVLSLLHLNGRLLSSHSDGTIKVWDVGKRLPRLVQEVREHTKAITCLYVPSSGDKLYSGSFDKTIRVWSIKPEEIHCIQVHDVKEAVYDLTANSKVACYISHGTGVKVYNWSGTPKHIISTNM